MKILLDIMQSYGFEFIEVIGLKLKKCFETKNFYDNLYARCEDNLLLFLHSFRALKLKDCVQTIRISNF